MKRFVEKVLKSIPLTYDALGGEEQHLEISSHFLVVLGTGAILLNLVLQLGQGPRDMCGRWGTNV